MLTDTEEIEKSMRPPQYPSQTLAVYDWKVTSLDGQNLNMADLKGKVVFLNFWATWCAPCVAELPNLQRLYEKTKDNKIVFAFISQEDSATVKRFMTEKAYSFPAYILADQPPMVFKSEIVPTTFVLSPDGTIAFKHVGVAKWDDESSINFINELKRKAR